MIVPDPKHFTDFSDPDNANNTPFALNSGAEIKDGAPGNVGKALRIDRDGPFATLSGVDISPDVMPECTLAITFYLESIPRGSRGWLLNHDSGGFDRCLALHDERFNGIGHGVGYQAGTVYNEYTVPPTGEWIQMVMTYRQGGECAVFVNNDKAPITHIGKNNKGKPDLTIGRVDFLPDHWCDCWVKDVGVYDVGLSDEQVNKLFKKFEDGVEQQPAPASVSDQNHAEMRDDDLKGTRDDDTSQLKLIASLLVASGFVNESLTRRSLINLPQVFHQKDTPQNYEICSLMSSILLREYRPSILFGTRTMLNSSLAYMKPGPININRQRENIRMTRDGAMIPLDWEFPRSYQYTNKGFMQSASISKPVVLILHGANTDTSFGYMRSMMNSCTERGWLAVGMNSRGCGGSELATHRFSNAAYTNDLRHIVDLLCDRLSPSAEAKLFIVGFSLGANHVVKYLGEMGDEAPNKIAGAISLCNPMEINYSRLKNPWSQILSFGAKAHILNHKNTIDEFHCPHFQEAIKKSLYSLSLSEMNAHIKHHLIRNSTRYPFETSIGYQSTEEYLKDASSRKYIGNVSIPLLISLASDDDIAQNTISALSQCLANPNVVVVITPCGGHIGWHVSKRNNPFGSWSFMSTQDEDKSWADRVTVSFIDALMKRNIHDISAGNRSEIGEQIRMYSQKLSSKL